VVEREWKDRLRGERNGNEIRRVHGGDGIDSKAVLGNHK
jgi:hypothetical protein